MSYEKNIYHIDEEDLEKIEDLQQGVALAIEKIIRGKKLLFRAPTQPHPAVTGLEFMIRQELKEEGFEEMLSEVF